jgi:hypothetical protein
MKPENKAILDANRHHYETATKAGYVKHFNAKEKEDLLRVMREEFQPGYYFDMWCPPCVFDFIKLIYQRYDAWIAAQPKEPTEHIHATFPKIDPPKNTSNEQNTSNGGYIPKRNHHRRR